MNSEVGKRIGLGACSEVFEWENDKVIKLFRTNTNRYAVKKEYRNSVVAWENRLPVPRPYEMLDIEGQSGIVYERVIGETLLERFFENIGGQKNKEELFCTVIDEDSDIRTTARLLFVIHSKTIPDMLNQRIDIKQQVSRTELLTDEEKQSIYSLIDSLPVRNCLCHGDPNPGNIILRNGEPIIIDWMNASAGNPEVDIAELILIYKYYILPPSTPSTVIDNFNYIREILCETLIDEYLKLSDLKLEEINAWILPIAAAKLFRDGISYEEKSILVDVIRKRLYDQQVIK